MGKPSDCDMLKAINRRTDQAVLDLWRSIEETCPKHEFGPQQQVSDYHNYAMDFGHGGARSGSPLSEEDFEVLRQYHRSRGSSFP